MAGCAMSSSSAFRNQFVSSKLIVSDMNNFLELYNGILGMDIANDKTLTNCNNSLVYVSDDDISFNVRQVSLRSNYDFIGRLTAIEIDNSALIKQTNNKKVMYEGDTILIFNVDDIEKVFNKIATHPGVRVVSEISTKNFPDNDNAGSSLIFKQFQFFDANNFFVECNQWMNVDINPTGLIRNVPCDLMATLILLGESTNIVSLYRDTYGLEVQNDFDCANDSVSQYPFNPVMQDYSVHLTTLKTSHNYVGLLAFQAYSKQIAFSPHENISMNEGDAALCFNVSNLDEILDEIKTREDITIVDVIDEPGKIRSLRYYHSNRIRVLCTEVYRSV